MQRGGMGTGSASIILVFAVLCLTIFSLISLSSANADMSMADTAAGIIKGYYEADTLAECILADILGAAEVPANIRGIDIVSYEEEGATLISFSCPATEAKELYVEVVVSDGTYEIKKWHMKDSFEWEIDFGMPVWQGD